MQFVWSEDGRFLSFPIVEVADCSIVFLASDQVNKHPKYLYSLSFKGANTTSISFFFVKNSFYKKHHEDIEALLNSLESPVHI